MVESFPFKIACGDSCGKQREIAEFRKVNLWVVFKALKLQESRGGRGWRSVKTTKKIKL